MQIHVNGQRREVDAPMTVADLLVSLSLPPRRVAIELNLAILPRARYAETRLSENDSLEIVTLVGGG